MYYTEINYECWKVDIETSNSINAELFFKNKELARLAVEWAYQNRLVELASNVEDPDHLQPEPTGGGLNNEEHCSKKIVWWKRAENNKGWIPRKEYFYFRKETYNRCVIG
jgi:hypothetical protein